MTLPTNGIFEYLAEAIGGLVIVIVTYYITKKRMEDAQIKQTKVDTELTSADVIIKNLEIYQNMLEDVEKRYEEKLAKRDEEIRQLEQALEVMRERLRQVEEECGNNKKIIENLKK